MELPLATKPANFRHLLALAHVYTQISYCPVPLVEHISELLELPVPPYAGDWDWRLNLEQLLPSQWEDLCRLELSHGCGYLPGPGLKRTQINVHELATTLYEHIQSATAAGARYILWGDNEYPAMLRNISFPPLGLTTVGDSTWLQCPSIAVVGSRKASGQVVQFCYEVGSLLAKNQLVCVSGGAFGCDIAAHSGVLASGQAAVPAVVVFAQGLAELYPTGNRRTFAQLRERGGLLVSERLWKQVPRPMDFPIRNRIISGLASHTIIMLADQRSGALTTAYRALDQGREVLVLRHPPGDIRARGSHQLIDDGAVAFSTLDELVALL